LHPAFEVFTKWGTVQNGGGLLKDVRTWWAIIRDLRTALAEDPRRFEGMKELLRQAG